MNLGLRSHSPDPFHSAHFGFESTHAAAGAHLPQLLAHVLCMKPGLESHSPDLAQSAHLADESAHAAGAASFAATFCSSERIAAAVCF